MEMLYMNTYNEYLKMPLSLPLKEMTKLHNQMIDEIENDELATKLFDDLLSQASSVTNFV